MNMVDDSPDSSPPTSPEALQMWGRMVFREIERVTSQLEVLNEKVANIQSAASKVETSVAVLNVKAGIVGCVAATIVSMTIGLAFKFLFKS